MSMNQERMSVKKVIGYKDVFPIKAGLSGLRLASPYACSVLNNDNLVLLKNGVHAVRLLENVATDERIVVQRSKPILQALMDNELSSSVGFSYDNKYYLALGNNIYVADGSQWYDSQNYEWFIYKNIDVKMFFLLDSNFTLPITLEECIKWKPTAIPTAPMSMVVNSNR